MSRLLSVDEFVLSAHQYPWAKKAAASPKTRLSSESPVLPLEFTHPWSVSSSSGWQPVNSVVYVTNGTVSRRAIFHFTADAGVSTAAEIRLAYRVDIGAVQVYGPQNFANHTEYWQSQTNLVVIPLGPGTHRLQPYWRISGATGKTGVVGARCLTAESQTL